MFQHFDPGFRRLSVLDISFCNNLSPNAVIAASAACPELEALNSLANNEALFYLASRCSKLQVIARFLFEGSHRSQRLYLTHGEHVTDQGILAVCSAVKLRYVAVMYNSVLTGRALQALAWHCNTRLQSLSLTGCSSIPQARVLMLAYTSLNAFVRKHFQNWRSTATTSTHSGWATRKSVTSRSNNSPNTYAVFEY